MFKLFQKNKGQTTLEYAVLVIIIIGALLTIQTYVKRGVQGRLKSSADDIGDQFSPGNTNALKTTLTHSVTNESLAAGATTSTIVNEQTNTQEKSQIANVDQEYWGSDPAAPAAPAAP